MRLRAQSPHEEDTADEALLRLRPSHLRISWAELWTGRALTEDSRVNELGAETWCARDGVGVTIAQIASECSLLRWPIGAPLLSFFLTESRPSLQDLSAVRG